MKRSVHFIALAVMTGVLAAVGLLKPIKLPELQPQYPPPAAPVVPAKQNPTWTPSLSALPQALPKMQDGKGKVQGAVPRAPDSPAAVEAKSQLVVTLEPGMNPDTFARDHGLGFVRRLRSDLDTVVLRAAGPDAAAKAKGELLKDPRVRTAFQNRPAGKIKHYVPNDPYYPVNTPTSAFPGQWHLGNGAFTGIDPQILPAWARDNVGSGVVVGMVDDGLETTHPDLAPAYDSADSFNFGTGSTNPNPVNPDDDHGTATSGLVGARGGNRTGLTGTAPFSSLSCQRVDFAVNTSADVADAIQFHANGSGNPIKVKNHSYGDGANYQDDSLELNALSLSSAVGTVHMFSAGNSRGFGEEDSNKQGLTSSSNSIVVAALGSGGRFASYSNFGACVTVCTPSWDGGTGPGVTTTDRMGANGYNSAPDASDNDPFPDLNYTSAFGGTSAAAPIATGVVALARELQPNLSVRLVKHLLARTCSKIDPNDASISGDGDGVTAGSAWKTNNAGFHFNQNYGFGLIQADAFTKLALQFNDVTSLAVETTGSIAVNTAIPENNPTGVTQTFSFAQSTPLEELLISMDVTHTFTGDLRITVTSPRGTTSRLLRESPLDPNQDLQWTFLSNAFWGENPNGLWHITVADVQAGDTGTWNSFTATSHMGTPVAAPFTCVLTGPKTASAGPIVYSLLFNQTASSPSAANITISHGTLNSVSGGGLLYSISVTPTAQGTVTCQVGAGASTNGASTPSPATATVATLFDSIHPVCTVSAPAATKSTPIPFTISFSETVTPLTQSQLVVTGGTILSFSGSGTSYTVLFDPAAEGNVTVTVPAGSVFDQAWNPNPAAASDSATSVYDVTPPNTSLTGTPPSSSFSPSATFTFTSTETGTFQVSLDGGAPVSNATGTVTFTNLPSGPHSVSIAAVDAAGNVDPTPAVYSWTIVFVFADTTAPLLNPLDSPLLTTHFTFTATGSPGWAADATPGSVLGTLPFFTGPASLNYNNGADDSSGATANSGTATTPAIAKGPLTTVRLKFMCNYALSGSETRSVTLLRSDLTTVQSTVALSPSVDQGLGLCAAAGIWHEHSLDISGLTFPVGVQFGFNTVTSVAPGFAGWFVDDLELSDLLVSGLAQYPSGGGIPIPVEATTTATSIDFRGIVSRAAGSTAVQLDIEVKPLGTPFSGVPTASATATGGGSSPTSIAVSIPLGLGPYHWQARTVSPPSTGTISHWMEFGLNATTDPDFTVVSVPVSGGGGGGGGGGGCGATGLEGILLAIVLGRWGRRRNQN